MFHQVPEQMPTVPTLQQPVSRISITVGPLVLSASEIPQTLSIDPTQGMAATALGVPYMVQDTTPPFYPLYLQN